jgi:hypothetical protein
MNTNTTQLKQETLVGNDPVLEDIYPKTDSSVVFDNGIPVDQMIDRLWNSINNKLSRVVNSVNGRSGVVVLKKEDVGLSNVDNVSFADIKQWVIDQFAKANNHLQLVDTMADIDELCATNDKTLHNAPFFAEHGYQNDVRPYIGYIYWDNGTNQLMHDQRPIPIIGEADASIIYNEVVGSKDYSNGKIGVNIVPGERILKLRDTGDKSTSGLYIDDSEISSTLLKIDGVYGNGTPQDEDALLYFDSSSTPQDAKTVNIIIDGELIQDLKLKNTDISKGTLILCDFKDYRVYDSTSHQYVYPTGMLSGLCGRTQAIGKVTQVPDETLQINTYVINFYTLITQYPGWGLKQMEDHTNQDNEPTNYAMTIDVANRIDLSTYTRSGNTYAGLQVFLDPSKNQTFDYPDDEPYPSIPRSGDFLITPRGAEFVVRGGLGITTDYSLTLTAVGNHDAASSPEKYPDPDTHEEKPFGSKEYANWASPIPGTYSEVTTEEPYGDGVANKFSAIGVNLNKNVQWKNDVPEEESKYHGSIFRFANISGLRIEKGTIFAHTDQHHYNERLKERENKTPRWFGMNWGDARLSAETMNLDDLLGSSGGISVNVGKFLEIDPGTSFPENNEEYYESGKINVRIGYGLHPEPETEYEDPEMKHPMNGNRIEVFLDEAKGLEFIKHASERAIGVKLGQDGGLAFDANGGLVVSNPMVSSRILRIKDGSNNTFDFNPTGAPVTQETPIDELLLGAGLKITTTS